MEELVVIAGVFILARGAYETFRVLRGRRGVPVLVGLATVASGIIVLAFILA